ATAATMRVRAGQQRLRKYEGHGQNHHGFHAETAPVVLPFKDSSLLQPEQTGLCARLDCKRRRLANPLPRPRMISKNPAKGAGLFAL
ncbi:hypothetical protein, partial [Streptomyces sp. P17]|uniref:hypothetical protein n=1 Tax=Streptomyces sp. P17 TaxID=3074716 RepID=UPI0028F41FB8